MTADPIRAQLETNPLLNSLGGAEIELIVSHSQRIELAPGQVAVKEDECGDALFFVLDGELLVSKNFAGIEKPLGSLSSGDSFGEISLVSDAPRTATVTAKEPSACLKLDKATFEQLLADNSRFGQKMMKILTRRMIETERAAGRQLLESYQALIFALSDLAESRDPETGEHLLRVQNYCRLLATLMQRHPGFREQISDQFIEDIYVVSPLHDIGKVGIPDGILLKPGPLSDDEFAIMKTHVNLGAKTLEQVLARLSSSTFRVAHQVVSEHHERYDGSGYPKGLAGEEISLAGRIMALADVYDALLSRRIYKEPFSYAKAKAIIQDGRGTHFDPQITDLFLENIHQFEAIHRQHADSETQAPDLPI